VLLYEHPLSSYAQKVKIALREKGVAFDPELPTSLGAGDDGGVFAAANPRREVPVLIDGDDRIFESTVIMEYIEDRWPTPPLLPKSPSDLADTLRAEALRQTKVLQSWLQDRLGAADWFGGETFGWADAAAAPMVNRSAYYGMGPAADSALGRWHRRLSERPSVVATFAEFDAAAAMMKNVAALYAPGGGRKREYRDHRLEWMLKSGGLKVVTQGLKDDNIRFSWPDPS
jgi:RNA polymerase-associated protein